MPELLEWVVEPVLRYGFFRNALAAAAIVGVTSAVLSCLLLVRHQALLGDAISHAVLPGVAVGYLVGGRLGVLAGALVAAIVSALAITYVERHSQVKLDAVMGIVFTFAFAVGLAVISVAKPEGIDLFHVLLGNVLGVDSGDLLLTAVSGSIVLVAVVVLFRPLQLWSFDPVAAELLGIRTGVLHYVFTALLSATIVASLQAVGLVLVVAMLVTPGATAYLLAGRLRTMMIVAAGLGLLAAVGGLYGSYHLDVASGPAIVIVASLLFALTFCFAPGRGVVAQARRRARTARRVGEEDLLKRLVALDGATVPADDKEATPGTDATLRRLVRRRLVEDGRLTATGRTEALRLVRAHRLLERYLHDAEGVPLADVHAAADRLEHRVSASSLEEMDVLLGRPTVDPHGHPIPGRGGELVAIACRRIAAWPAHTPGVVAMVDDDDSALLDAMVDLGILPERQITVVGSGPDGLRAQVGARRVVIPPAVAERVFVVAAPVRTSVAKVPDDSVEATARSQGPA